MFYNDLAAVTGGTLYNSTNARKMFTGVSIDSRTIKSGELFIAIRGGLHDGHDYIENAINAGASGIIAQFDYNGLEYIRGDVAVVAVNDSHEAMIQLAVNYRNSLKARFIGITGSNGKTTTKELAYRLLHAVDPDTYFSPGNFNNLFGLPLSLFNVPQNASLVVLEMGISTKNEMPRLAEIVRPDIIVLTNVGPSHLEFLGNVENVARAKLELVKKAGPDVTVIVNADDPVLMEETIKIRDEFITFGIDHPSDIKAENINTDNPESTVVSIEGHNFNLPLIGKHQVYNLLAAYGIFKSLGYSFEGIDTSAIKLDTAPMRGQAIIKENIKFIADCYNSNPESLKAGLRAFFKMPSYGRRIIIIGDMLELGKDSARYHREIGALLANEKFDLAIVVGELSELIRDEAMTKGLSPQLFLTFDKASTVAVRIKEILKENDLVYLKASRGIGLEKVLNAYDSEGEQG